MNSKKDYAFEVEEREILPEIMYGASDQERKPIALLYQEDIIATEIFKIAKTPHYLTRGAQYTRELSALVTKRVTGKTTITEKELYSIIKQVMEEKGLEELAQEFAKKKRLCC